MLKIVAGEYRSRVIETPDSLTIPSKSIVRTGLSNALMNQFAGAEVLDLFAGSGALGLEALSRGAHHAVFVDSSPAAAKAIRANIATLKAAGEFLQADYRAALDRFQAEKRVFDIVYLDPPYALKEVYQSVPALLLEFALLSPCAAVVLEYEGTIDPPVSLYRSSRTYNYGRTHVLILWR